MKNYCRFIFGGHPTQEAYPCSRDSAVGLDLWQQSRFLIVLRHLNHPEWAGFLFVDSAEA